MAIRGAEIVRQLMIFAGDERGPLELVDVSSLVNEMLELLKVSISKHAALQTSLERAFLQCVEIRHKSGRFNEPGHQRFGGDRRSGRSD